MTGFHTSRQFRGPQGPRAVAVFAPTPIAVMMVSAIASAPKRETSFFMRHLSKRVLTAARTSDAEADSVYRKFALNASKIASNKLFSLAID